MEIVGDTASTEFAIRGLIEHECGFLIEYRTKKVRIGFCKGVWHVMNSSGEFFDMNDIPNVQECANPLLKGFIVQRLGANDRSGIYPHREVPSLVIIETLRIWADSADNIVKVTVTSSMRNNWFHSFDE